MHARRVSGFRWERVTRKALRLRLGAVASHGSPPCTSVRNMCMNFGLVLISAGFNNQVHDHASCNVHASKVHRYYGSSGCVHPGLNRWQLISVACPHSVAGVAAPRDIVRRPIHPLLQPQPPAVVAGLLPKPADDIPTHSIVVACRPEPYPYTAVANTIPSGDAPTPGADAIEGATKTGQLWQIQSRVRLAYMEAGTMQRAPLAVIAAGRHGCACENSRSEGE